MDRVLHRARGPSTSITKTECHPLSYFRGNLKETYPYGFPATNGQSSLPATNDQSSVQLVGAINGLAIYDVFHNVDGEPTWLKIIVVERKPGEFCEIYAEGPDAGPQTIERSYIDTHGSENVLVTHDPVAGNGGIFDQAYWTFDHEGPILDDFFKLIDSTLRERIAGSTDAYTSFGFIIRDMLYDNEVWKDGDGHAGPSGGHITIKFAFVDHKPVVVGVWVGPPGSRAADAPSPTP